MTFRGGEELIAIIDYLSRFLWISNSAAAQIKNTQYRKYSYLYPTDGVRKAKAEELSHVAKHNVYKKVPIAECKRITGKGPIDSMWLDIDKGSPDDPEYRSRFVAKDLNTH